jgi:toxin ParE1/3/4
MFKLLITELAHQDLDDIVSYISVQLGNVGAAARLLDDLDQCYSHLRENPQMFELCRDHHLAASGYRKVPINNYVLIYKVDNNKSTVTILRIFYGGRDYPNII